MVSMLWVLLFGIVCGFVAAIALLLYILSSTSIPDTAVQHAIVEEELSTNFQEECPTHETKKLLNDAVEYLVQVQEGRETVPELSISHDNPTSNVSLYQLEQTFQTLCSLSKVRAKQLKSLPSFISDVGKAYAAFAKDLSKLSAHARSNIKSSEQQHGNIQQNVADDTLHTLEDSSEYADDWWRSLSLCLSHLSNDNDELSEIMSGEYAALISQTCEEQTTEEKRLSVEGSRLLSQLKEGLMKSEHLAQDRDKWRLKVASTPPEKVSVMGTMTSDESNRRIQKLQASELVLLENMKIVNQHKNEFRIQMPKIFSAFRSTKESFFKNMKIYLMKVSDGIRHCNKSSDSITNRLKSHISATSTSSRKIGLGGIETKGVLMGFESMLHDSLVAITKAEDKNGVISINTDTNTNTNPNPMGSSFLSSTSTSTSTSFIPKLNMSLESTACLAASASNVIPNLPSIFKSAIGQETCVWFNAFSGRVYRDAARSNYFHTWLLEKLSAGLNKGNKPGFIDEFKVESVVFGSTPPLLFNIQWSPKVVQKTNYYERSTDSVCTGTKIVENCLSSSHDKGCDGNSDLDNNYNDGNKSSGNPLRTTTINLNKVKIGETPQEKESIDGQTEINQNTESPQTIPVPIPLPIKNSFPPKWTGNDNINPKPKNGVLAGDGNEDIPRGNIYNQHNNRRENDDKENRSDGDEDIECTADMAYRSGLKFKISTRLRK